MKWRTEQRKISELKLLKENPRILTEAQRAELEKSLKKFNLAEIPVIDRDNVVLAGNQRVAVLKALGRNKETIDVRIADRKLTKAEKREYTLRSNRNTGEWDFESLAAFGKDLLEGVGFTEKELAKIYKIGTSEGKGELEFTEELLEERNFVVFIFDNSIDWLNFKSNFELKRKKMVHHKTKIKTGVGRVIDGKILLAKLK